MNSGNVKVLQLPVTLERKEAEGTPYDVVTFADSAIAPWTLALVLLREGLAQRVRLSCTAGNVLQIEHDSALTPQERAVAVWDGKALSLRISGVELEYWIDFFLRYFRDGYGAVPHLDIDTLPPPGTHDRVDIVFKIEHVGPAMTPQEAKRLLRGKP